MKVAAELGAPTVRVTAGWARSHLPSLQCVDVVLAGLGKIGVEAKKADVIACLENHLRDRLWPPDVLDVTADVSTFLELSARLSETGVMINFDNAQPLAMGIDEIDLFDRVVPQVRSVHLSDRRRGERRHAVIGDGDARIPALLGRLKEVDYSGFVALEDGSDEGDDGLRNGLARLTTMLSDSWGEAG
jgi:sugar phosphate isomerase/epimerase